MLTFPLALTGMALWCWPDTSGKRRLRTKWAGSPALAPGTRTRLLSFGPVPLAGFAGAVFGGIGGMFAALALTILGFHYWRVRQAARRRLVRTTALASGVGLVVAELRAGAHPAAAAEGAAAEVDGDIADVFGRLATTTRLGGEVRTVLNGPAAGLDAVGLEHPLGRIVRAWELAHRHGVALAELLDSVRRDVAHRAAFLRETEAAMAGPRATALVLTGLPVLGLLLGQAVGADPLAVLTGSPLGQLLLLGGVGLLCLGAWWALRLTEAVVSP